MTVVNQVGNALTGSTGTGSFVGSAAPTFTGIPILAAPSATSLTFSSTSGIIGTTTNDNAAAGSVGELISSEVASGSAVSLTTATAANVTFIDITAGDWDIFGNVFFVTDATTNITLTYGWTNTISATLPATQYIVTEGHGTGGLVNVDSGYTILTRRYSVSGTTRVYLSAQASFTISTMAACGNIYARRRR